MVATDTLGTRLSYHLTENTAYTPHAAGAALPTGYVQVFNVQDVDAVLSVIEDFDDGDLEDSAEVLVQQIKAGKITFSMKRNGTQAQTLLAMCNGTDINSWAVTYDDAHTMWTGYGRLKCTSSKTTNDRSLRGRAMLNFEIVSKTVLTAAAGA